jgi:hypothetical protein
MARRYGFGGSITSAATKTVWGVTATAAVRPAIYDITIGSNATPADNASEWWVLRFTAAGTSTPVTPEKVDSGDPAATSVCGKNHSVEPTYGTVPLIILSVNQRATVRWVASPGSEFKAPATAANGLGLQCQAIGGSGVATQSGVLFEE